MKRIYLSLITILSLMGSAYADRLVIKGSDTLGAKLVPQLAEQFKAQHPGTTFDIAAEGSTTGIAAIIDGTAQIGMSSRRAKSSEVGQAAAKGINMKPTVVAYDGIAVIVNAGKPVKRRIGARLAVPGAKSRFTLVIPPPAPTQTSRNWR